jgi:hypothetical protein
MGLISSTSALECCPRHSVGGTEVHNFIVRGTQHARQPLLQRRASVVRRDPKACGGSLTDQPVSYPSVRKYEPAIQAVEEAYRAALLGVSPHPSLVGKATDRAFRRFVDDMLQLLISFPQPSSVPQNRRVDGATLPSRQSPLVMIAELISNAAPSSDTRVQSFRYRQSLKIWPICLARSQSLREIPWSTPAGIGPRHCSGALPPPYSFEPEDGGQMIGFDGLRFVRNLSAARQLYIRNSMLSSLIQLCTSIRILTNQP